MTAPSRRDRTRPFELLGIAAVVAVFVGLCVLFAVRDPMLALVFAGVAFVVTIVVLATLVLATSKDVRLPDDSDDERGH